MKDANLSNDDLASRLRSALREELSATERQWPYESAAAVLSYYDMERINPLGGENDREKALASLLGVSSLVYDDARRPRWTLRAEARAEALRRLADEGRLHEALEANPSRPEDALQRMLEAYILESAPPLGEQTHEQLRATLQISEWLSGRVEGLPAPDEVNRRMEAEGLFATFRFLVGDHFRGREAELARLSDYVGIQEASSAFESLRRGVRRIRGLREKPPLFIYGPGGTGKSTLLAKFILDHARLSETERFPFAYLDFDRPSLAAEEPLTLLLEAVRQLAIQFPESRVSLERTRQQWLSRVARQMDAAAKGRKRAAGRPGALRLRDRKRFLKEFAAEMHPLLLGDQPFLLVLDTFEEVQYRSRAFVVEVFKFLDELQSSVPTLRAVISGRAQVEFSDSGEEKFETDDLELGNFDAEAAQGFLIHHGLADPELAAKVAEQVGGSPLTLKLAAELLRKESAGSRGIRDLKTRDWLFSRVKDEAIQAQLFGRILDHIHDPRVRALAHPGLTLRRITPDLIREVLAEPCGVKVESPDDAEKLFDEMAREVALVTRVDAHVLEHRPDLRGVMLLMMREKDADRVAEIHARAVRFYERFDDDASRAEEIYHRLSLGLDRAALDERWRDGLNFHASAVEEMPPRARAFLAARMGVEIAEGDWAEADLEDWELHARQRALDLMELDRPLDALAFLGQREGRSADSPLAPVELDVLTAVVQRMWDYFSVYTATQVSRRAMAGAYEALRWSLDFNIPDFNIHVSGGVLFDIANNLGVKDTPHSNSEYLSALADALAASFDPEEFRSSLLKLSSVPLSFSPEMSHAQIVRALINLAAREGWLLQLVEIVADANPDFPRDKFVPRGEGTSIAYGMVRKAIDEKLSAPPHMQVADGEEVKSALRAILAVLRHVKTQASRAEVLPHLKPFLDDLIREYAKLSLEVA